MPPTRRSRPTAAAIATRLLGAARLSALLLCGLLLTTTTASAHPHARFSYQLDPVMRDGAVIGLKVTWLLDPLSSMTAIRGIDLNRNGVADPEELDAFARQNDTLVARSGYFLTLSANDTPLPFTIRQGLRASLSERGLSLDFEVALAQPATDPVSVRLFDETWYVALSADDPPIPAGHACQGSAATQALSTQGWGAQPVPVVRLDCRRL